MATLVGTRGDDTINGSSDPDTIYGGTGPEDTPPDFGNDVIDGKAGSDTIFGFGGNDTLRAGDTNSYPFDYLYGGDGDDTLYAANSGTTHFFGGAGNDTFYATTEYSQTSEYSHYEDAPSAVTVNLQISGAQNTGGAGFDTFVGHFLAVVGSAFDDTLIGDNYVNTDDHYGSFDNFLRGGAGNDTLLGMGGEDTLHGEEGDDILDAGDGDYGRLSGGPGNDRLKGGGGYDILIGDEGDDILDAGPGTEYGEELVGGSGFDTASYASAEAAVTVRLDGFGLDQNGAQNTVGAGYDYLHDIENLTGSAYRDVLIGSNGPNVLDGGQGNDDLWGGQGNDTLLGRSGDDLLQGGPGTDTASFVSNNNGVSVNLAAGQATGAGTDTLVLIENVIGTAYNDVLIGDSEPNVLEGVGGSDMLNGGAGFDIANFSGVRANFQLHLVTVGGAPTTLVKDGVSTGGTDTLVGIELFFFAGAYATYTNAQQNLVSNVDGARFDDVVYRSVSTGQVIYQNMTDGTATGFDAITNPLPGWTAIGTGDWSDDGKADAFIWNSTSGFIYSVLPGASGSPTFGLVAGGISGAYTALDVADINGDGAVDLLVREANSGSILWQNSANNAWDYVATNLGSAWSYQASGDVDYDGYADVVIRDTSGQVYIAAMAGGQNSGYIDLGNLAGYQVRTVADVNADGADDVVVQRESDGWTLWRKLGGGGSAWNVASDPVGTSWVVKGAADVDNDGSADLIYQNSSTGETLYRAMDYGVGTGWQSVSSPLGTDWVVV